MSFYDDASLVFLPSGQAGKDGKAYSMKPTDGSGDFTFSRGSNLTATRVDSNGLIEKGRENLLLQSNQFDTTWTTSNSSVTSGQSGYDGSSDAWLLENTSTSFPRIEQAKSISGVVTCSIYAKAGTNNFVRPLQIGGSNAQAYFDLSNGTIANESNVIDAKIESVGSGWYRCSITFDGATTAVRIYSADAVGSFALGNTIIQSAQLEIGLVATEYIESGATTGLAGILEDSPRFDYSGGASCPSLLLEPSRTNLVEYSEAIEFGISTNQCTQTITNQTNPSGNNASYLASAIDSNNDQFRYDQSGLSSGSYFLSAFVKGDGNANKIRMRGTGGGVTIGNVYWDVTADGTISLNTSQSPSGVNAITESYGNGWYRIGFEETYDGSSTSRFAIYPSNGDVNASMYVWGVQWEQGSYPTSYIPNHSGGSVTREVDVCEGAGTSSTFNDAEGVLYLEASAIDNGSSEKAIAINDGTTNNRINIRIVNNTIKGLVILGGSLVCNISYTATSVITSNKIAFKYKRNDFALWLNGVEVGTDTSGSIFPADTLNELSFDYGGASAFFYGNVEQVLYFPTALSDVELTALTS